MATSGPENLTLVNEDVAQAMLSDSWPPQSVTLAVTDHQENSPQRRVGHRGARRVRDDYTEKQRVRLVR